MTRWQIESSAGRIAIAGELRTADAAPIWRSLRHHVHRLGRGGPVEIDLAQAAVIDGTVMALIVDLRAGLATEGVSTKITGASDRIAGVVHLYGGDRPPGVATEPRHARAIARFGAGIAKAATQARRLIEFSGELVRGVAAVIQRPRLGGLITAVARGEAAVVRRASSTAIDAVISAIGNALIAASDQLADRVVDAVCDRRAENSSP